MLNNESKHLLLNWATRQRPGKFMKNLDAYLTMASGKHRITVVVSMDKDDLLCNNQHFRKFLDNKKSETVEVIYSYGESLGKIAAINRDIPATIRKSNRLYRLSKTNRLNFCISSGCNRQYLYGPVGKKTRSLVSVPLLQTGSVPAIF